MRRSWFLAGLSALLLLAAPLWAGKSGFSGGSVSRSSFSGGSSFRSSSGFSGGSSFRPSAPSFSRPAAPAAPSTSSSGFSGGSKPPTSIFSSSKSSSSSGISGGSSTTTRSSWSSSASSQRPAAPSFDKLAISDAKKAESRANYDRAQAPAPSFKTGGGKEVKIDPASRTTTTVREYVTHERWVSRPTRTEVFYQSYVPPVYAPVFYSDPFHPFLQFWLLKQQMDTMSLFVYHHQDELARSGRLNDLYAQNAELKARVAALEAKKIPKDDTYVPPGVDRDVLYSDEFVTASYNPTPKPAPPREYRGPTWCGFWRGVWVLIKWLFFLSLVWLAVWAFFCWRT